MNNLEKEGIKHLRNIEKELEEIRDRTTNPRRSFLIGIVQGAGAILGSICAIALIGWVLSLLGIIPGFSDLAEYLRSLVHQLPRRI